ncbi:MAG: alginate export family protein [Rhodobacter sp.]|nr:alginate export family protein [Cupriavidus sp.]MCA3513032.1 alginate export family protein [Rhodobacter sp.]
MIIGGFFLENAAQAQEVDEAFLFMGNQVAMRGHLQAGLYLAAEGDAFWNLAEAVDPDAGYDPRKSWQEAYAKLGVSFESRLKGGSTLYGKFSAVSSYTRGSDPFDQGDNGATTVEEAYLAFRGPHTDALTYDLSLGPREFKVGNGMLISSGAASGFERGALKFGPRKAWEMAAIAKLSVGGLSSAAFYLEPNELPSNDGGNALAGVDLRYGGAGGGDLGLTYVAVLSSYSPYPQAAPGGFGPPEILAGARETTQTVAVYGATAPFEGILADWEFTADLALQRNMKVDLRAWAGRVQASYSFADLDWSPRITLGYQTFSGDDPNTSTLERFDPLYYEGSPSAWATGTKSASTFINSNVNSLSVSVQLAPSKRDKLTARYAHIRANELRSPIQFGQATRVDTNGPIANVVSGVTAHNLADDFFIEYSHILNRNTFLTAGVAVSFPGSGIRNIVGNSDPWTGSFINLVINY